MEKIFFLSTLRDLLNDYINSIIDRKELIFQLTIRVSPSEAVEYEDELLKESYFTIYHMDEKYCEVSNDELMYLRDCLEQKRKFSRNERDKIILKNSKKL